MRDTLKESYTRIQQTYLIGTAKARPLKRAFFRSRENVPVDRFFKNFLLQSDDDLLVSEINAKNGGSPTSCQR